MTSVKLDHLQKHFGSVVAVDDLHLEVESGEMVALLGPSGCGKTTTLRMITGLLEPSSGDVLFDGRSMLDVPPEKRGAVMVFQKHLLFPTMTIAQNVGFGLRMQKTDQAEIARRVDEMLELVQLPGTGQRKAHELSGGQQQRIALARALIVRPRLLLLDEPLANLDANLRLDMRELIRSIQTELGITSIFVTHDQEEAVMLADRIALLFDGVLQQFDRPSAFYERPAHAGVARFFRNSNVLDGIRVGDVVETEIGRILIDSHKVELPDGPVLISVRPEDVDITNSAEQGSLTGQVKANVYMGGHRELLIDVAGREWHVHAPTDTTNPVGTSVCMHLPRHKVWLLEPESEGDKIEPSE